MGEPVVCRHPHVDRRWMKDAACRGHKDPELFFDPERQQQAVKVCLGCPVRLACFDYVLAVEMQAYRAGVYAGFTPGDRKKIERGA